LAGNTFNKGVLTKPADTSVEDRAGVAKSTSQWCLSDGCKREHNLFDQPWHDVTKFSFPAAQSEPKWKYILRDLTGSG
jgi:hypothetical protein